MNQINGLELGLLCGNMIGALVFFIIFLYFFWQERKKYLKYISIYWGFSTLSFIFSSYITRFQRQGFISILNLFCIILAAFYLLKAIMSHQNHDLKNRWLLIIIGIFILLGLIRPDQYFSMLYLSVMIYLGLTYIYTGISLGSNSGNIYLITAGAAVVFGICTILHPFLSQNKILIYYIRLILAGFGMLFGFGLIAIHNKDIHDRLMTIKDQYKNVVETQRDLICRFKPDTTLTFVNGAYCRSVGLSREELLGHKYLEFIPEESREHALKQLEKVKAGGKPEKYEHKVITESGEILFQEWMDYPLFNEEGEIEEFQAVGVDITEGKRMEERLKKENEKLKTIFEASSNVSIVIAKATDDARDAVIEEVNSGFENIFGYSREEIIGETVSTLNPEKNINNISRIHKTITRNQSMKIKTELIRKNGERFPALSSIHPFRTDRERLKTLAVIIDISELEEARKQLQMTQFSVDKAEIIIFRVTPGGLVDYANDKTCEKLEYMREEFLGLHIKNILPEDQFESRSNFWQDIKSRGVLKYERDLVTKKGDTFPAEIYSHYFAYNDEEYEFVFARDITERKEAHDRLRYLSYHDRLTGLYNRHYLEEEIDRLDTERQLPISILMCDVNGLKVVNDSYGHKKGDQLLTIVADILKESVREEDIVSRWAGDEFLLLLPHTGKNIAGEIRQRIKEKCTQAEFDNIPITLGIGIATKVDSEQDIYDVLNRADDSMYHNKLSESRSGRNKIVKSLLSTLSAKSDETAEHAVRMTGLALQLGDEIDLDEEQLNNLSLLATLHDIGKITVPKKILTKTGRLTEAEWEIIKEHPQKGARIVATTEDFAPIARYVLSHHEHWDGSGYPRGLKGKEIPLLARIITIVDAYDVMTNGRTYKEPMSKEEALEELKRCAGSQFDPELVTKYVQLIRGD